MHLQLRFAPIRRFALPLLVLAAPSVWMLTFVPPLWRDVDAYVQTVYPPGANTILLHGPLYCTLSRLPLWIGYLASASGPPVLLGHFIEHTQLTNAGITALIMSQHVALWGGVLFLISAVAVDWAARLVLAVFIATQPVFYAFAHCVGSETLSMILILYFIGIGLRITHRFPAVSPNMWLAATTLLCCCILTRQINRVLAGLLPAALALVVVVGSRYSRAALRQWVISIATGVVALVWASAVIHLLCWHTHTPWRPQFGYTFVWRLNFLSEMEPQSRRAFLDAIATRSNRPDVQQLSQIVNESFRENSAWHAPDFARHAKIVLSNGRAEFTDAGFDNVLNAFARAALVPPLAPLRAAAIADFADATTRTETDAVAYLFLTTAYYHAHTADMPQLAGLRIVDARGKSGSHAMPSYFYWWSAVSLRAWTAIAAFALIIAVVIDSRGGNRHRGEIIYVATAAVVGLVMLLINCFFAQFQERFTLPALEGLLVAVTVALGVIVNGASRYLAPESR